MTDRIKGFPQGWYVGTAQQATRDEIRDTVLRARPTLDLLRGVVAKKMANAKTTSPSDYDCPSWPYKAADQAGYQRALREIYSLTQIEGDEA